MARGPMGPGPGGPHGGHGPHGPRGPMFHEPRPMFFRPRMGSYLGTGLSALIGSALGTSIANSSRKNTYNNYNNYYEVFSYCPECGTKRNGNSTTCVNCGSSLIK